MAAVYPEDGYYNPNSWSRCASLTPHLLTICETEETKSASEVKCAELLNKSGSYFYGRSAYSPARPLFERALAINEKVLGPEHPDTATSLDNLAGVLHDRGELVGARSLLERALAIREKALGSEHPIPQRYLRTSAKCYSTMEISQRRGRCLSVH
jgi:Tfp pilus assembly protein PilF